MREVMNLTFASSISDICEVNKSFDSGKIRIAYVGDNRNKTHISREAFEKALPSIYNCPVVCNYDISTDTIGGHDLELVKDVNGAVRIINATNPIGVIPESAKTWFEKFTGEDGVEHEYLYAEALFWKRQAAYQKIKDDGITNQSMEIAVTDGEKIGDIYHINNFEFTAFTAIGVEPCFENAAIELFSKQSFKDQLTEMMNDLRESFSLVTTPSGDDIHPQNIMKGDIATLEDKVELAAKYGIDVDSLDFNLEDFTIEELTEKFEAMQTSEDVSSDEEQTEAFADDAPEGEEVTEGAEPEEAESEEEEFALNRNVCEEIRRELRAHPVADRWGDKVCYWLQDYDPEAMELYVEDPADGLYYSFKYSMSNDSIAVDYESKKRVKCVFVEFVEGAGHEVEPARFELFKKFDEAFSKLETAESELQSMTEKYNEAATELTNLRQYKADIEAAKADAARTELFSKFVDLADIEAFKELQAKAAEYDLETLEEKCYAIRGRHGTQMQFSLEESAPKIKLKKHNTSSPRPYGGVVEEYLGDVD